MKLGRHFTQIGFVLLLVAFSVSAQSSDDLKSKYGAPFKAFEIRPGIMMTVQFAENGQASEMRIVRHAATNSMVYLEPAIPPYQVKEIVDELVPVAERGAKGKFSGLMLIVGNGGTSTDDYEHVAIIYHNRLSTECSGVVAIVIKWKNRTLH